MELQFNSFAEFLNMGGYAFYVWLAYGVAFGSLTILIVESLTKKRRILKEIAAKVRREERLAKNRGTQ